MGDLCECRTAADQKEQKEDDPDEALSFTLTDPDVLVCPVCVDPLTLPVYQCQDGHIICSSCSSRMLIKECPTCSRPIGQLRCRAIEKVIESIQVACKYRRYGCKEILQYSKKLDHSTKCPYSIENPDHIFDVMDISFDKYHYITLEKNQSCLVLRCEVKGDEHAIFVLNNVSCSHGNAFTVSRVSPLSTFIGPCYDLTAEKYGEPSFASLSLHSSADCYQEKVDREPGKTLFVPDGFDLDGKLFLKIRIKNPLFSCGISHSAPNIISL